MRLSRIFFCHESPVTLHQSRLTSHALSVTFSMKYWLLKSEPSTYSIDDLARGKNRTTAWTGVRNHQARNFNVDVRLVEKTRRVGLAELRAQKPLRTCSC
jgi:hypothetical protein